MNKNIHIAKQLVKIAKEIVAENKKFIISDQDLRKMIAECYFDEGGFFSDAFNCLEGQIGEKDYAKIGEKFHEISMKDPNLVEEKHHANVEKVALYLGRTAVKECRKYLEEFVNVNLIGGFGDLSALKDPKGGSIIYHFYTSAGSEYIMSENGMSRRIKSNQGRGDEGLHDWEENIFFTKMDGDEIFDSAWYLMFLKNNVTWEKKWALDGDELCILYKRTIESGNKHKMDTFKKATGYFDMHESKNPVIKIQKEPEVGLTVIEITGQNRIHVGHAVSKIDWKK